jgi:ribonucleoside-diphosphate reductase alpha chain
VEPDHDISRYIWESRYRYRHNGHWVDSSLDDSWWRVAHALADVEGPNRDVWARRFHDELLAGFAFLPGGRILAGAGTEHRVTLFNCFVMGVVPDSMDGIFKALRESALTLQHGGGIGADFSALRPAGWPAAASGTTASGPVSFMRIWNEMAGTLQSLGQRRSAMMATLRCDHPDILDFIAAKRGHGLENFNLAVQCTEEFLHAVERDATWALVFPADAWPEGHAAPGALLERRWPGRDGLVPCRVAQTVRARALWDELSSSAAACGDPGVLFVDRINQQNNLWYDEYITAANPCGEVPLPAHGACNLGSFNLTAFVDRPFSPDSAFDMVRLRRSVPLAVRLLDNAIDVSHFPLPAQAEVVRRSRRIGLGVTGLADTLIMLGLRYDSPAGRDFATHVFRMLRDEAYRASVALVPERGPFPAYDPDYLSAAFIQRLPDDISGAIAVHGIRNSHLLAQAPTGTVSLLAGNVSSGIEPVFDFRVRRDIRGAGDYPLTDYAWRIWQEQYGDAPPPAAFVTASQVTPAAQLAMLAAIQPYVDNSISKTVALPAADGAAAAAAFHQAYGLGLKGCTVFTWNGARGVIHGAPERAAA